MKSRKIFSILFVLLLVVVDVRSYNTKENVNNEEDNDLDGKYEHKINTTNKAKKQDKELNAKDMKHIKEIMSHICHEDYKLCDRRKNEMNIFTDTSPCDNCSCHPIYCQIANNCCPDVRLETVDEDNVILPVCMQLNDVIETIKTTVNYVSRENNKTNNSDTQQANNIDIFDDKTDSNDGRLLDERHMATDTPSDTYKVDELYQEMTTKFELADDHKTKSDDTLPHSDIDTRIDDTPINNSINNDNLNVKQEPTTNNEEAIIEENKQHNSERQKEQVEDQANHNQSLGKITIINDQLKADDSTKYKGDIKLSKDNSVTVDHHVATETLYPEFLVIDKCPNNDVTDIDTKKRCENKESLQLLDYIPVSTFDERQIYRNAWCAKCNNKTWENRWKLMTNCMNLYEHYLLPSNISTFLKLFTSCTGYLVSPSETIQPNEICKQRNTPTYQTELIAKCNKTKNWEKYNKTVLELCENMKSLPHFEDMANTSRIYSNIFCYLCNTGDINTVTVPGIHTNKSIYDYTGIYLGENKLYMNVETVETTKYMSTDDDDNAITCLSGYVPDLYSNVCIPFRCPLYQVPTAYQCVQKDIRATGLVVASTLLLSFPEGAIKIGNTDEDIHHHGQYLNTVLDNKLELDINGCKVMYVRLLANYTDSDRQLVKHINIEYKISNTQTCPVKKIIDILDKLYTTPLKTDINAYSNNITGRQNINTIRKAMIQLIFPSSLHNAEINITLIDKPVPYEITLLQTFNCPSILINISYYKDLIRRQILPNNSYTVDNTGLVSICYHTYITQWYEQQYKQQNQSQDIKLSVNLSFYSTIVSMISIILVLLTYFLFPELRYLPGKLFMMLCFNLLIAQTLFTFGIGLEEDTGWCTFTGMMIHLFWLATIFSMNSNLLLLYDNVQKPFNARIQEIIHTRSNCTVYRYICYCYTMSIAFVLTNIILSSIIFHDKHYGYGGSLCYINTPIMRIATFILPLLIVLIVNFSMFVYIMCNISNNMYKHYSFAYKSTVQSMLKLSTITGVFWVFGYLYQVTGVTLLEYIFTVLNAGQGFFLLVSFLVNKKVLQLYKNMICMYIRKETREHLVESSV
ncbi:hypothetical protein ACF0H5_012878 [Mactra antiquata]